MKKGWATKVAGSMLEREILKAVEFWYPKARPMREGIRWLVWSVPEWQTKVGMQASDKSIRRALTNLREQGILLAERHRHPYVHNGGPVLWVRPNERVIDRLLTGNRPNTDRILTETIYTDNSLQISDNQAHSGEPQQDQEDQVKGADFLAKKKAGATISEAMKAFGKGKTAGDHEMIKTPEQAHNCLRDACLAAGYAAPGSFNKMRGGQMKTMLKRINENTVNGPWAVAPLLFFVCARWPEFINWSKSKYNVTVQGTSPNHSSFTMFAVEAVGFWQTYTPATKTVKENVSGGSSLDEEF